MTQGAMTHDAMTTVARRPVRPGAAISVSQRVAAGFGAGPSLKHGTTGR